VSCPFLPRTPAHAWPTAVANAAKRGFPRLSDSHPKGRNRLALVSQAWRIIGSGDAALQGRDRGIGVSQLKTRAGGDNSTCFGGRRRDEYLRRNIRTYSSMSREVLSALRITHVLKHSDVSESGFTTTPSA